MARAREPVLHRARDDAAVRRGAAVRPRGIGEHRRDVRVCAREPAGLLPPARAAGGLLLLLAGTTRWPRRCPIAGVAR